MHCGQAQVRPVVAALLRARASAAVARTILQQELASRLQTPLRQPCTKPALCPLALCSPSCGFDLFLTQDFGASWTNLTANSAGRVSSFRDFDWGCKLDM